MAIDFNGLSSHAFACVCWLIRMFNITSGRITFATVYNGNGHTHTHPEPRLSPVAQSDICSADASCWSNLFVYLLATSLRK